MVGAGAATAGAGGGRFGEAKVEIEEEIEQKEQRETGAEDQLPFLPDVSAAAAVVSSTNHIGLHVDLSRRR